MISARTVFIYSLLFVLAAGSVHADVRDDLQGLKKEIKEKKLLLKKTAKVETKVTGDLAVIEKNLKEKEATIASLGRELHSVEVSLEKTGKEIENALGAVELKKAQIAQRLSALYKSGEFSDARIFFSSESFPEMVENIRYSRNILENDRKLVTDYNAEIERLTHLKEKLETDAHLKEKIKAGIEKKKQEVSVEKEKKAALLVKVRGEKSTYLASIRQLEANARRLQSMMDRLEARSRKNYSIKQGKKGSIGGENAPQPLPDKGFGAQKGRLSLPARGEISARFGKHKHPEFNSFTVSNGISIAAPAGTDIRSVYEGQVIFADYFKGYGNMIIVDHGSGFFSLYAHAAKVLKKVGSPVSRNETLASVGDVDSSAGSQLYFEIRYQGKPVDPSPWFR